MTGAELRAWRERLGKDEAWAKGVLNAVSSDTLCPVGNVSARLVAAEKGHMGYSSHETAALRVAYRAALEAEEARQAAERGPAEPVCPEGVTTFTNGYTWVRPAGHHVGGIGVEANGAMKIAGAKACLAPGQAARHPRTDTTVQCLRYAADLSEYRAAIHAASDKQRKLDAVKAAEEAHEKANAAYAATIREHGKTEHAMCLAQTAERDAWNALQAARQEAGL